MECFRQGCASVVMMLLAHHCASCDRKHSEWISLFLFFPHDSSPQFLPVFSLDDGIAASPRANRLDKCRQSDSLAVLGRAFSEGTKENLNRACFIEQLLLTECFWRVFQAVHHSSCLLSTYCCVSEGETLMNKQSIPNNLLEVILATLKLRWMLQIMSSCSLGDCVQTFCEAQQRADLPQMV